MNRLVLIDGNAILHRAYHALPPLTTKDGRLVNAVYGFSSMLLKVINDLKPTHLAVAFDRPEPTFRHELYKNYQAQRPAMDDELSSQFPIVRDILEAMRIAIYEKAGYEADDVIGTIAKKCQMSEVIIVTGDRDILQLVDKNTKVYMPVKGLTEAKLFKTSDVVGKYGISPSQIVDYKALIGDPSDNYPGVSGIGPKTAARLLVKYKNLVELYDHLDEIDNKNIKEKLKQGRKNALLAKKLAMIVTEVPMEIDSKALQITTVATLEIEKLFKELEFNSLLKRLRGESRDNTSEVQRRTKSEKKSTYPNKNQLSLLGNSTS